MNRTIKLNVFWVFLAILLLALGSPMVKLMVQLGGKLGVKHPHALSFCNVLLVGNLCAALIQLLSFGVKGLWKEFWASTQKAKLFLLLNACLAIFFPSFIYTALETTTVTRVVLISRFGTIFLALIGYLFFKQPIMARQALGFLIIGVGAWALVLASERFMLNRGDFFVLFAAFWFALSSIATRKALAYASLRLLLFTRNFFSALFFYFFGLYLFGPDHFSDIFTGELWIYMSIYGLLIIVLGQFLWFSYKEKISSETLSMLSLMEPFFTLSFAFLLLDEQPGVWELLAMLIILSGYLVSHFHNPFHHQMVSDNGGVTAR